MWTDSVQPLDYQLFLSRLRACVTKEDGSRNALGFLPDGEIKRGAARPQGEAHEEEEEEEEDYDGSYESDEEEYGGSGSDGRGKRRKDELGADGAPRHRRKDNSSLAYGNGEPADEDDEGGLDAVKGGLRAKLGREPTEAEVAEARASRELADISVRKKAVKSKFMQVCACGEKKSATG